MCPPLTAKVCEGLADESLGVCGGQELKISGLHEGRSHQMVTGELSTSPVFQCPDEEPCVQCPDEEPVCPMSQVERTGRVTLAYHEDKMIVVWDHNQMPIDTRQKPERNGRLFGTSKSHRA